MIVLDETTSQQGIDSGYSSPSRKNITFIDLFAGMGGTRIGFEQAVKASGFKPECLFTSEVKSHAVIAYKANFDNDEVHGDIKEISPHSVPNFDYLLAGFPCQPFSSAGNRHGFLDERGGLFFTIYEILKTKKPEGFLLENVDGLVTHNNGDTFSTILSKLRKLGYYVDYKVLDALDFGVPQKRNRVYIIGSLTTKPLFARHIPVKKEAKEFINYAVPFKNTEFSKLLISRFDMQYLEGKSIKDKRGGANNIHSWDIDLKGKTNKRQRHLLSEILKKRRYKKWAENKGIEWMDGMPLTSKEISTFLDYAELNQDLEYLSECGYLKYEHPKEVQVINGLNKRVYKTSSEKGYNIVAGKLSFPIAKILAPNDYVPTIVATEVGKIAVATKKGVRKITVDEGLSFSGFDTDYDLSKLTYSQAFDLLGNTVMPPVIYYVSKCLINSNAHLNASKYTLSKTA